VIGQPSSRIQHWLELSDQVHHFRPARTLLPLSKWVNARLTTSVLCCFSTLWQLRSIRRQVPTAVFQSLVVALVLSRLDYCKTVLVGLAANLIWRRFKTLQHGWFLAFAVLNTTDALASLHWLRVPERILFKVAVLTYRTVNDSAPVYMSSYFTRVAVVLSRLRLRSSTSDQLIVPSYNLASVSRRVFQFGCLSLDQSHCTSHISTVAHGFPAASWDFFSGAPILT